MDQAIRTGDEWTVEEVDGHLADLIEAAVSRGPQRIVLPGRDVLVVLSAVVSGDASVKERVSLLEAMSRDTSAELEWPVELPAWGGARFPEPLTFDD